MGWFFKVSSSRVCFKCVTWEHRSRDAGCSVEPRSEAAQSQGADLLCPQAGHRHARLRKRASLSSMLQITWENTDVGAGQRVWGLLLHPSLFLGVCWKMVLTER